MLKIKSIIPPLYELYVVPSYFNIKNPRKCKGSFNSSQSWQSILYTLIFFFIFIWEMQHGLLIIYLQVSYWFLRIQLSILFARIPSPPLFPNQTAGYQARRYVLQWPKKSPKRVLKNFSSNFSHKITHMNTINTGRICMKTRRIRRTQTSFRRTSSGEN